MEPTSEIAPQQSVTGSFISAGELMRTAWRTTISHWKLFFGIVLIPALLSLIATILFAAKNGPGVLVGVLFVIAAGIFTIASQVALIGTADHYVSGSSELITVKGQYKFGFRKFWQFLWVSILSGLSGMGIILLCVLFAAIISGLIAVIASTAGAPGLDIVAYILVSLTMIASSFFMAAYLIFSTFSLIVDDKRGISAIQESITRVRGHWWATFGRLLALIAVMIIAYAVIFGIQILADSISGISVSDMMSGHAANIPLWLTIITGVLGIFFSSIVLPFAATYSLAMYRSLGQIKTSASPVISRGKVITLSVIGLAFPFVMVVISLLGALSIFSRQVTSSTGMPSSAQMQALMRQYQASSTSNAPASY